MFVWGMEMAICFCGGFAAWVTIKHSSLLLADSGSLLALAAPSRLLCLWLALATRCSLQKLLCSILGQPVCMFGMGSYLAPPRLHGMEEEEPFKP